MLAIPQSGRGSPAKREGMGHGGPISQVLNSDAQSGRRFAQIQSGQVKTEPTFDSLTSDSLTFDFQTYDLKTRVIPSSI